MIAPARSVGDAWWTPMRRTPSATRCLFCFPYAGGNASLFRAWPAGLPTDLQIYALQLPGRASRIAEPPLTSLPLLVDRIGEACLASARGLPYAFFGHSLGAVLSFEVARWMRRRGSALPWQLVVAGRRAPDCPQYLPPTHQMTDADLIESLARMDGTSPDVLRDAELMQIMLPTLRADFGLAEGYTYVTEPPLACGITVIGGQDDPESQEGRLEGWQTQTSGRFDCHLLDGGHFFIRTMERELLALLALALTGLSQPAVTS